MPKRARTNPVWTTKTAIEDAMRLHPDCEYADTVYIKSSRGNYWNVLLWKSREAGRLGQPSDYKEQGYYTTYVPEKD